MDIQKLLNMVLEIVSSDAADGVRNRAYDFAADAIAAKLGDDLEELGGEVLVNIGNRLLSGSDEES